MNGSRIQLLDLARFIAAMAVVIYHYIGRTNSQAFTELYDIAKFGFLGVPFFFIISGYVISISAENASPRKFAVSRFIRLFPTLWLCCTLTFITLLIFEYPFKDVDWRLYLSNLLMINSFIKLEYVDNVYWTLFEELKFYALIFFLLLFNVFHKFKVWLAIWLVLSISYFFWQQPFFFGKVTSITYSSYFIAGVCFYLLQSKKNETWIYAALVCSFALSSYYIFGHAENYISRISETNRWIVVFINFVFYVFFWLLCQGKLSIKPLAIYTVLGGMTYPLYLLHNLIGKSLIHSFSATINEHLVVLLVTALSLILAYIVTQWFEKPWLPKLKRVLLPPQKESYRNET